MRYEVGTWLRFMLPGDTWTDDAQLGDLFQIVSVLSSNECELRSLKSGAINTWYFVSEYFTVSEPPTRLERALYEIHTTEF